MGNFVDMLTSILIRHTVILYLHIQEGGPHSWQYAPITTSTITSCLVRRLQSSASTRQVSLLNQKALLVAYRVR